MRTRRAALVLGFGIGLGVGAVVISAGAADAATTATLTGTGRLTVSAGNTNDNIVVSAISGSRIQVAAPGFLRRFPAGSVHFIRVNGGGGNDTLRIVDNLFAFTTTRPTTLDGGPGNDTITGGKGAEVVRGRDGDDTVIWTTGRGNDQVEGGAGADTQRATGTTGADVVTIGTESSRARLRVGAKGPSTHGVEVLDVRPVGGADTVRVNDLTGSGATLVDVDLGVNAAGDAAVDSVELGGTTGADVVQAAAVNGVVEVTGLSAQLDVAQAEAANDRLTVNGLGNGDTLSGNVGLAALIKLTIDGGDGNDVVNGGNGADTLIGGTGNDTADGNGGNDTIFQGDGNDTLVWDPGDGSDVLEGQNGTDTLLFNGAPGAEIFAASSNGGRLLFTRNVGNIVMDVDDVETLHVNALGGIDTMTVNNLEPTDVGDVDLNLGVNGVGDGSQDAITVNGTVGDDSVQVTPLGGGVGVRQPDVDITVTLGQLANDTLTVNASGGDDTISSSSTGLNTLRYTFNGGANNDVILGTPGDDTINGDDGDDTMFGRDGADTFTGGTGTDLVYGGAGADVNGGGIETFNQ